MPMARLCSELIRRMPRTQLGGAELAQLFQPLLILDVREPVLLVAAFADEGGLKGCSPLDDFLELGLIAWAMGSEYALRR